MKAQSDTILIFQSRYAWELPLLAGIKVKYWHGLKREGNRGNKVKGFWMIRSLKIWV
nr:hypothetical protein [Halomonas ilicicola]